jgi:8-oxo-dGTP pyrophosphatase MutT (NUDIX family)
MERILAERQPRDLMGRARRAAVLVVLYDVGPDAHLVLTKRTETVAHPGQISLPGGRVEESDRTMSDTALRETEEEVGIPRAALHLVGRLDDVHTMASDFVVRPFIAVMHLPLAAVPDAREVARVLEVRVADVLASDAVLPEDVAPLELRYPLAGEDVWGATARILRDFCRVARDAIALGA